MKEDYLKFILSTIERFKAEGRRSAVRIWRSALCAFVEATGLKKLPPGRLTRELLVVCKEWMLARSKSHNTINAYLGALQTAYNRQTQNSPHHVYGLFKGLRPGSVSTVKRSVDESTMSRLVQTDSDSLPPRLRKPFAWFLLLFYLRGIPFIDLAHLRKSDLRDGFITYRRRKTGRELTVEVPAEAMAIIKRYAALCPESPYLLPILKGNAGNLRQAYCEYEGVLRRFNERLRQLSVVLHTEVKLSSYTARHTWATIAYYQGVPLGIISKALGHSSVRITEFYLKPFENKEVDKTNRQMIKRIKKRETNTVLVLMG